jgi:hypothetical protein
MAELWNIYWALTMNTMTKRLKHFIIEIKLFHPYGEIKYLNSGKFSFNKNVLQKPRVCKNQKYLNIWSF